MLLPAHHRQQPFSSNTPPKGGHASPPLRKGGRQRGTVEKVFHKVVGADWHVRPKRIMFARLTRSPINIMETIICWRKRLMSCRTVLKGRHTGLPLRLCGYHNHVAHSGWIFALLILFQQPHSLMLKWRNASIPKIL